MIRSVRNIGFTLAAAASLSCFPGRFDDLEKSTWVQIAEKNGDEVNGDLGVDAIGIDLPSGTTKGGAFVASSAGSGGITQIVFDETGGISSRIGNAGTSSASGTLGPLNNTPIYTLAPYVVSGAITGFVAGQPFYTTNGQNASMSGVVVHFATSFASKGVVQPNPGPEEYGDAILVGDFGSGAGTPDIVVISLFKITVVSGVDGSTRSCGFQRPNFPTGFAMGFKNAALAKIRSSGGTASQLIVSGKLLAGEPRVMIYDPSDISDTPNCPDKGFAPGGSGEPPMTLAVGDVDNDGHLDLVTSTNPTPSTASPASIKIYNDIGAHQDGANGAPLTISGATPSTFFGSRLLIDKVDGTSTNSLVIGDPDATVGSTSGAGKVYIWKGGTLVTTLSDPDPDASEHFGRALASTSYKTAKTSAPVRVLGVGGREKLWVYFRLVSSAADPREL